MKESEASIESAEPTSGDPELPSSDRDRAGVRTSRLWLIGGAVLVAAAVLVYLPAMNYDFVGWDDDINILGNEAVSSPDGLSVIWSDLARKKGMPNYPMFYTSLWLDYRLWGAEPGGYHATNVVLHAINCLLVMLLLHALGLSRAVSWIVALFFALHPAQVESVAWITERKNVLSATFYLTAFLLYVRYLKAGRKTFYGLAFLAYVLALLGKTSSITLVASLFLADILLLAARERRTRSALLLAAARQVPFIGAGIAASVWLISAEGSPMLEVAFLDRILISCAAVWFYIMKLVVPIDLIPVYPRWSVDTSDILWWLPLIGLGLTALAVLRWWAKIDRRVLWCLGHFAVTLLPMLGLVEFGYNDYSFVADRYVYLACIGLFAIAVLGAERGFGSAPVLRRKGAGLTAAGLACAVVLATLTAHQIRIWRNSDELWTYTAGKNPSSWTAQHNYGNVLYMKGRRREALSHWWECVRLQTLFPTAQMKIALTLRDEGDLVAAEEFLRSVIRQFPKNQMIPMYHALLGDVLALRGKVSEAVLVLQQTLNAAPGTIMARDRLAWIHATCMLPEYRNGELAVQLAEQAVKMTGGRQAETLDCAAAAHAECGRFDVAVQFAELAVEAARKAGNSVLAGKIEKRLAGYRNGIPFRQPVKR